MEYRENSLAADVAALPGGDKLAPEVAALEATAARVDGALCSSCGTKWSRREVARAPACPSCGAPRTDLGTR